MSRHALVEPLEQRRLLAGDFNAGVALPYQLDFNRPKGGLLDRDGTGTGFTWAQPNGAGNEFSTRHLDLKIGVGILRLYSQGTAWKEANTLVNALTTRFSASSRAWVVGARVNGTIPQIDEVGEEGGIIIGPDQDNYVKLVASHNGSVNMIQFFREINGSATASTRAEVGYLEFNATSWATISRHLGVLANAGLVQRTDHRAELRDTGTALGVDGVRALRRGEVVRVVAPVEAVLPAHRVHAGLLLRRVRRHGGQVAGRLLLGLGEPAPPEAAVGEGQHLSHQPLIHHVQRSRW